MHQQKIIRIGTSQCRISARASAMKWFEKVRGGLNHSATGGALFLQISGLTPLTVYRFIVAMQ